MNKIAIDLLWVKPNKNGGSETLFRNVLDGFLNLKNDNKYVLIVSKSNAYSFEHYLKDKRFEKIIINIDSNNLIQRMLWINLNYYKMLRKNKIDFCFFPTYAMPMFRNKKIKTVTGILDLQALHYPEYFSKFEKIFFRMSWKRDTKVASKLFTISDYSKNDIETTFKLENDSVKTIYATCEITDSIGDFKKIAKEFDIKENEYYYTVSSLLPHKNLMTLIKTMDLINRKYPDNNKKLVISGTGGKDKNALLKSIKELNLQERVIITRFVSNEERNSFYKNASIFVFPSIFEGFGMPPVEAMMIGTKVITTLKTSLPEVTQNKAYYVTNPFDDVEWAEKIIEVDKLESKKYAFTEYSKNAIAQQYLNLFEELINSKVR